MLAGPLCYFAVSSLKIRFNYDDSLDAFGIHGVGGIFGALATGVFATTAVNSAGVNGLLMGNPHLLWVQLLAVLATAGFASIMTVGILKMLTLVAPLRVSDEDEDIGLDLTQHGEDAYNYGEVSPA